MKDLIVLRKSKEITQSDIDNLELNIELTLPNFLKELILNYGGCRVRKNMFTERFFVLRFLTPQSNRTISIEKLFGSYKASEDPRSWLPFAIDSGGWVFNVSITEETYGQVWVDRFDSGDEDSHTFVASSLEEFIEGLEEEN